jgi:hypothetical protein
MRISAPRRFFGLSGLTSLSLCLLVAACASAPTGDVDECMTSGWIDRADAASMQAFFLRMSNWEPARFDKSCTATADTPRLTAPQRLRLALAYGAQANPRRSHAQTQRLLNELPEKPSAETEATIVLVGRLLDEQNTQELKAATLQRVLEDTQTRAVTEAERAELATRRANDAQARAVLAEEKLREAERRFADTNVRLNDATRRLEALRSVELALSQRSALRRTSGVTSSTSTSTSTSTNTPTNTPANLPALVPALAPASVPASAASATQ